MSEYSKKAYEGSKELINQAQILRNLNLGRSAPGRLGKSQGLATSVRRVRDMPLRPAKQERKPIGAAVLEKQYRDLAASLGMGLGIGAGSLSKSLSGPQLPTSESTCCDIWDFAERRVSRPDFDGEEDHRHVREQDQQWDEAVPRAAEEGELSSK